MKIQDANTVASPKSDQFDFNIICVLYVLIVIYNYYCYSDKNENITTTTKIPHTLLKLF